MAQPLEWLHPCTTREREGAGVLEMGNVVLPRLMFKDTGKTLLM